MDCSKPGLPVHHQLPEFTQTHVHRVSDAIQPSHPLSSPSPPALNLSQHQSLFQWVSSLHQVAKVLEFQLQHQVLPMNTQDWSLGWTGWISLQSKGLSRVFSNTTVQVAHTSVSLWTLEPQITPALNLLSPPSPLPSSLPQQSLSLIPRQTLHIFKAQLKRMLLWQSDSSLSLTPPNKDRQTTLTELTVPYSPGRENCVVSSIWYSLTPGTSLLISEWMDSEKPYK